MFVVSCMSASYPRVEDHALLFLNMDHNPVPLTKSHSLERKDNSQEHSDNWIRAGHMK